MRQKEIFLATNFQLRKSIKLTQVMRELKLKVKCSQTSPNGHLSLTTAPFFRAGGQKNPHIDSFLKPVYKRSLPSVPKMAVVEKFNCKHFRIHMNSSWLVPNCLIDHVKKHKGTTAENFKRRLGTN